MTRSFDAALRKPSLSLAALMLGAGLMTGASATAQAADAYSIDAAHTNILFEIDHLGFSTFIGEFTAFDGAIQFDADDPAKSSVEFTIEISGVSTDVPKLDEHLIGPDFFDAAQFPTATFKSTAIEVTGENTGKITGDLTMKGVTKPVTLDATLNGAGKHPFADVYVAGFSAETVIKRSDWGVSAYSPAVGEEVTLIIELEGHKQ
ncbi:MAG: YceI family protein [Rhodospirillaceae bacterium]